MVDNGLGVTLLPQLAIDGGILKGTDIVARPLEVEQPQRDVALIWRKGTARGAEFRLLAQELKRLARRTSN
jgi:LysR family hydrogen peroxide-inducible transcriptional activator